MKRGLTLVNAMHITASVFINDDEYGLHQDYEKWLEGLAPHAPIDQYWHHRTGEACPERSRGDNADAHMKRAAKRLHFGGRNRLHSAGHGPRRAAVVAVTNGRLDGSTEALG